MKIISIAVAAALIGGCATQQPDATKVFYMQEKTIGTVCLMPSAQMSAEERFTVDPNTGISPIRLFANCYSDRLKTAGQMMRYPHMDIVNAYADYVVRLTNSLDKGLIPRDSALTTWRQSVQLFEQSIATADAKVAAQARRNFTDKLAILGAAFAEQDRQRVNANAASTPVTCTAHGIYEKNTVICR